MIDKQIINMRKLDEIVENCYNAISQYESYLKKHELEEEMQYVNIMKGIICHGDK